MRIRFLRFTAWGAALGALAVAAALWGQALARAGGADSARESPMIASPAFAAWAETPITPNHGLRERNPFRLHRTPATRRFGDPVPAVAPEAVVSAPATLELVGMVGPPWVALVEGLPGRQQAVLLTQEGDVDGFVIEAVRGDTVVVAGLDTTWVLTTKRSW